MNAKFERLLEDFSTNSGLPMKLEPDLEQIVFDVDEKYTLKIALTEDSTHLAVSCQIRGREVTEQEKDLLLRINTAAIETSGIIASLPAEGDDLILAIMESLESLNVQMLMAAVESLLHAADDLSEPMFMERPEGAEANLTETNYPRV